MVIRDNINSPAHYAEGRKYETIDVIEDWNLNFRLGNAVKYLSRTGRKDPSKAVEDLRKAVWYIEREITALKAEEVPFELVYDEVVDYLATEEADVDDQALEYWDTDDSYMFEPNVTAATEKDWEDFWHNEDVLPNVRETPVGIEIGGPTEPVKNEAMWDSDDSYMLWDPTTGPIEPVSAEKPDYSGRDLYDSPFY